MLSKAVSLKGYKLDSFDGEIGKVKEFLISPQWIERVSWSESKVFVNLSRNAIKRSPEYTEASFLTRDYETELHRHYDRQGSWVAEMVVTEHPN